MIPIGFNNRQITKISTMNQIFPRFNQSIPNPHITRKEFKFNHSTDAVILAFSITLIFQLMYANIEWVWVTLENKTELQRDHCCINNIACIKWYGRLFSRNNHLTNGLLQLEKPSSF